MDGSWWKNQALVLTQVLSWTRDIVHCPSCLDKTIGHIPLSSLLLHCHLSLASLMGLMKMPPQMNDNLWLWQYLIIDVIIGQRYLFNLCWHKIKGQMVRNHPLVSMSESDQNQNLKWTTNNTWSCTWNMCQYLLQTGKISVIISIPTPFPPNPHHPWPALPLFQR